MSAEFVESRELDIGLPDGRTLHVFDGGDPNGRLVVYHHGTPMAGWLPVDWSADARDRGLRLVGFDRAGYGGSTRREGRMVADVVDDVAALADALDAERFFTWGVSGGGPHALACAALLAERVLAAASIASVAPYDADVNFLEGMGQDNLDEFGAALAGPDALRGYLSPQRAGILSTTPEHLREAMASLLPDVDKQALTGEFAGFLHGAMAYGLGTDIDGWLDDDLAFVRPWGFDVAAIDVPLLILQGEQDLMVPFAHGQWIATQLPAATVRLSADEGHLSLLRKVPDVHEWLAQQV